MAWPTLTLLETSRLMLEPLTTQHAAEMVSVLAAPALHAFTGGEPPSRATLEQRFRAQAAGASPAGDAGWLNWIVRERETSRAVGTVQTTCTIEGDDLVGEVAWMVGVEAQGRGIATEAALAMTAWLQEQGVTVLRAHIHPGHAASASIARRLGLLVSDEVVDGEVRWQRRTR